MCHNHTPTEWKEQIMSVSSNIYTYFTKLVVCLIEIFP